MKKVILLLLLFLFSTTNTTLAYSVYTHEILSEKATENSKLALDKGDYLKDLGFQNNIDEKLSGKKVIELIKNGSVDEDRPRHERPRNHYHNPLPTKTWEKAGLDDFFTGKSSLVWAQDSENEFSWQAVRRYYLEALTTGSEDSFAKTFKGLGHIIHLLQDTAQPAHVRNDAHFLDPLGLKPRLSPGLETWSKNKPDTISAFASQPVFPAVNLSVSVPGYEPITQFFDTEPDTYDGTNPSTTLSQGLAEYTNANFVSDDTIFTENYDSNHKHYFPFPRKEDTIEYDEYVGDGKYRTYFKKIQNGEAVNHLATIERLSIYLGPWHINLPLFYHLDEQCHEDYTEKLIPRAVGYSTGLIDYFFRGEIDLVPDEDLGYGYMIENKTEEDMDGTFELFYDNSSDERISIWSSNFYLGTASSGNNKSSNFEFIVPDDAKDPGKYILVFKGRLGNETDAVVGKTWSSLCGEFKLTASDAARSDSFGRSVAISGNVAIVGAYGNDDVGSYSGSAYVFVRNGNTWGEQAKLTASDAAAGDRFGYSVAISGDVAIIGARGNDDAGSSSGSAYVFVSNGNTWEEQAKLTASDAARADGFGCSVAISGDVAVVGAVGDDDAGSQSGSAYVFVRNGNTWGQQAKLTASDAAEYDAFGLSVAISGDVAIVGARGNDDAGSQSGSAYVFVRNGNTWGQQSKLTASDAAEWDWFGYSVAISGDVAIIGASENDAAGSDSGSAYVFVRNGNTWEEQAKLTASDAAVGDRFGNSVAISGDVTVVGAYANDDAGAASGSAYVFVRNGNTWEEQAKLTASDAARADHFGWSVAISGDVAVVGSNQDADAGWASGSAYVYCDLP